MLSYQLFWSNLTSLLASLLQNLRQQILELLGPISMNHGAHFMAAIAYVWNERKQVKTPVRNKVGVLPLAAVESFLLPCKSKMYSKSDLNGMPCVSGDSFSQ